MFEALLVTLREGIEAALVVGIILVFLGRTDRSHLVRWVYAGLLAAVGASLAAAVGLRRLPVNEEAYEGVLMIVASLFVVSAVVWMWRTGRRMKAEIEGRLQALSGTGGRAAGWGLFLLTFLMVFREGAETILLLAAVRLTTEDLLATLGAILGLGLAVAFGVALVKGSVRVDLARFFRITGIVLLVFAVHLLVSGIHEFFEAGILPISREAMRVIGPIVKSQALVVATMLALPVLLLVLPGGGQPAGGSPALGEESGPAARLRRARARRERRWRVAAAAVGVTIIAALSLSMTWSRFPKSIDAPRILQPDPDGRLRLAAEGLDDGHLHRFGVDLEGVVVRFVVMKAKGELQAALDACLVCGAYGYVERDFQIVCLACAADINPATIGAPGGCNPIPLAMERQGSTLVFNVADLRGERGSFAAAAGTAPAPPSR